MGSSAAITEEQPEAPQFLKRFIVLALSISVALLATLLLSFVWEVSLDGKHYRRLYPCPIVEILLIGTGVVGCLLFLNEIFRVIRIPLLAYPISAGLYFLGLTATTFLFTYDFSISRSDPSAQPISEPANDRARN